MNDSKSERFLCYVEFDNEEIQEIMHKMQESLRTINDCVYQLERLGIAKVHREEKTAIGE